jgi:flap endonuclease-1
VPRGCRRVGIDLGDAVIKRPTTVAAWQGKTVAFDAWNILYQFLSNIRQPDGTPLMDKQGRVTSHLAGILYRTANLVEAGVRPVFVFDGPPHPLKTETLLARSERRDKALVEYEAAKEAGDTEASFSKAQQASRLTLPMVQQAQELLGGLGIPVVQAPGEGEAQAAVMCAAGSVDAVCSQDFDALLFGAPVLLRYLNGGRRKLPGKRIWVDVEPEAIRLDETLEGMQATREQLVDAAILIGTDYNPGIRGIGPKKALQLIRKAGGLEPLVERLARSPESADSAVERALIEQHANLMDRDTVRRLFLDPPADPGLPIEAEPVNPDAVRHLMVETHGFNAERVEAALQRFGSSKRRQQTLFDF